MSIGSRHTLLLAVLLASPTRGTAQEAAEDRDVLVVSLTVKFDGRLVERPADEGGQPQQPEWRDRKVEWRVGRDSCATLTELEQAMNRLAIDPASSRASPLRSDGTVLLPLRFEPDRRAHWQEVLQFWDAAMAAGFWQVELQGVGSKAWSPRAIDGAAVGAAGLIVPRCTFCEPDDMAPRLRPTFDVHGDGRIDYEGRNVFRWRAGEPDDLTELRAVLATLRKSMKARGLLSAVEGDRPERIEMPLFVRADRWAQWRDVQRLLQVVTDPGVGFWQIEVAVSER